MKYGFLDEAGDPGYARGSSTHFLVTIVVVEQPILLRKTVTKTRKSLGKRLRSIPELKAAGGDVRIVEKLLGHAQRVGFDAVCVVINKRRFPRPQDLEDLYGYACTRAIREVLIRFGALSLTLDKRYSNPQMRLHLNSVLASGVEDLGTTLVIDHENSEREYALQVADAVAWTVWQKYEHQDERLWQVIQDRITEIAL